MSLRVEERELAVRPYVEPNLIIDLERLPDVAQQQAEHSTAAPEKPGIATHSGRR